MRDPTPRPRLVSGWRSALKIASSALVLAACVWQAATAQQKRESVDLRLRVVAEFTGQPIADASVSLLAEDTVLIDHAVSDEEGRASLEAPPGTYRLRVERMDLEPWTSELLDVEAGPDEERTLRVPLRPVTLPGLDVAAEDGRCPGTREERRRGYERYREVVQALRPVARIEASDRHVFQVRVDEEIALEREKFDTIPAPRREAVVERPVATLDAATLVTRGYIQPGEGTRLEYYPPTAGVVVTDSFARSHCFRAIGAEEEDRIGVAFEPLPDREPPDVEGEVWLKASTRAPMRLDFTYTGLNQILRRYELPRVAANIRRRATDRHGRMNRRMVRGNIKNDEDDYGGRLVFEQIENGSWITRQWRIRMPIVLEQSRWNPRRIEWGVTAIPLERRGYVMGVGRVPGDSTASESDPHERRDCLTAG